MSVLFVEILITFVCYMLMPNSVLVLAGILVCSRIAALSAIAGSAIGAGFAWIVGVPVAVIEEGLFGFNPALTFSAMLMFYVPSISSGCVGVISSIITVFIQLALSAHLEPYGLPYMVRLRRVCSGKTCFIINHHLCQTLPFCFAALAFVIIQGTTSKIISVPLSSITTPEDHLKRVRRLSEGFELLFSAIRSPLHRMQLKRALSLMPRMSTSNKMSTILDEYDEEINGEQAKYCCARLFKRKGNEEKVQRLQSVRFSVIQVPLFHYKEKESYAKMFYHMKGR
jgi:hypothetical protein